MPGWCTRTIRSIMAASGNSMKWNTHRRRNAAGSSFSAVGVVMTTSRWRGLTVVEPLPGVVDVQAVLGLGRGLDVPRDERHVEASRDALGEHGLAGAGL